MNFDPVILRQAAIVTARDARIHGYSTTAVSPGDATSYTFVVARRGDEWLLGSTFGKIYPLPGRRVDPGYIGEKWIDRVYRNDHTERVYAAFINPLIWALSDHLSGIDPTKHRATIEITDYGETLQYECECGHVETLDSYAVSVADIVAADRRHYATETARQ